MCGVDCWGTTFPFLASIGVPLRSLRVVDGSPAGADGIAMGVAFVCQVSWLVGIDSGSISFGTPYYSISLSFGSFSHS